MRIDNQLVPQPHKGAHAEPDTEGPYKIYIYNDDVTPMDFVVHVLVEIFLLPTISAEHVMYTAHLNGRAYIQTLPAPEARRRIGQARFAARLRNFPLEFSMEAE